MQHSESDSTAHSSHESTSNESTNDDSVAEDAQSPIVHKAPLESSAPTSGTKPRGLWALMGAAPEEASFVESSTAQERTDLDLPKMAERPAFMKPRSTDHNPDPVTDTSPAPTRLSPVLDEDNEADGREVDDDEGTIARPIGLLAEALESPVAIHAEQQTRRRCYRAIALGCVSTLLAPLNLMPYVAAKVPGVIVGLVAVFIGHQAYVDSRRSIERRRNVVLSMSAITMGLLGMLSGPLGLNTISHQWKLASLQRGATDRLQKLWQGLDAYHSENDQYPKGGTVARDDDGEEIGMHGWMTSLLPFIGHAELAKQINDKQSYDHPSNRAVMTQVVPEFLVHNVEHQPNKKGLATTHFAGVGGQGTGRNGIVNYGIFDRNVTIRRSDVTDGLSQTLIVGEIAQQLPAWGDPENWREINTGLNRHSLGFGNRDGTGAHFLMGDGSVRFFPNNTSREVLESLSTRDGGEVGKSPQ